jgi:hypothetical protein
MIWVGWPSRAPQPPRQIFRGQRPARRIGRSRAQIPRTIFHKFSGSSGPPRGSQVANCEKARSRRGPSRRLAMPVSSHVNDLSKIGAVHFRSIFNEIADSSHDVSVLLPKRRGHVAAVGNELAALHGDDRRHVLAVFYPHLCLIAFRL